MQLLRESFGMHYPLSTAFFLGDDCRDNNTGKIHLELGFASKAWFLGLNLAEFLKRFLSPRRWCPLSSVILLPSCSFGLPILRQIFFSWAYKTDSHSTLLASISQSLSCLLHGTPHISLDNICMIVHVVSADCCFQEKISMGFFFFFFTAY